MTSTGTTSTTGPVATSGAGLELAERFYAAGHTDTRRAVPLHDVKLQMTIAGTSDDVRATMQILAQHLLDHDDVSELLYTVQAR